MEHIEVSAASVLGADWLLPNELSHHYVPYLSPLPNSIVFLLLFFLLKKKRQTEDIKCAQHQHIYIATNSLSKIIAFPMMAASTSLVLLGAHKSTYIFLHSLFREK
jgi:hypothetical protein